MVQSTRKKRKPWPGSSRTREMRLKDATSAAELSKFTGGDYLCIAENDLWHLKNLDRPPSNLTVRLDSCGCGPDRERHSSFGLLVLVFPCGPTYYPILPFGPVCGSSFTAGGGATEAWRAPLSRPCPPPSFWWQRLGAPVRTPNRIGAPIVQEAENEPNMLRLVRICAQVAEGHRIARVPQE